MAYLATIHQPSSIKHAVRLNLLSEAEESLVVAKANRLEIYHQAEDGLSLQYSKAIYGRVTMLSKLRLPSSTTDQLFVGTERYLFFTLAWDPSTRQLRTAKTYIDQTDKFSRDSQTGDRCLIDPSGKFLTLEIYEGMVTVIPIGQKQKGTANGAEAGNLGNPTQVRIPEMFVRSSTFFETRTKEKNDKPKLAFIYEDSVKKVRLRVRQLAYSGFSAGDQDSVDLEDVQTKEVFTQSLEVGASHLIPVPAPTCGILILGETSITYYEMSSGDYKKEPLEEATIFIAWEMIDRQRFVLGDEYGKLYLLMLELDERDTVKGWRLDVIGETSRASTLVYLDAGKVFVGSHQGDSQVIAIRPKSLEVVQTFPNIAPILDFAVMDMGSRGGEGQVNEFSSGQARLVTGSGAFKDGSLRSVRSGVGLESLGFLGQMDNIVNIFSLKSGSSQYDDTLVVSFVDETRVFVFDAEGEVEELSSLNGLTFDQNTLYASNISQKHYLQATASFVRITDIESGMETAQWTPPSGRTITAITANDEVAVVSIGGSSIVVLGLTAELAVKAERNFDNEAEVACLNVSPSNLPFCVVGFWQNSSLAVLDIASLKTVHQQVLSEEQAATPRSILLLHVLQGEDPTLFVAMADGNVITYSFSSATGALSKGGSVILGTQQANFRALPRGTGIYNVLATCEHPSLIYGSEGRLVYSAVTADQASCVCPFDSEAFPGALAIATSEDLKLAVVDEERKTHVQGLHVGETVRRIAYSTELQAFGLGTIQRTLMNSVEVVQSHFKLADEVMFKVLATFQLNNDELIESVMRTRLDDGSGDLAERFVVGTAYIDDENPDAIRGRILIFEVTEDRTLNLIVDHAVKGACRCLATVEGNIVAALVKTVVVYALEYETASRPFLVKKASYRTSTAPIDLAVTGLTIAVADLMKSVSVIQYQKAAAGSGAKDTLTEVSRHMQTTWGTAVAQVDENMYLESDVEGNLLLLLRDMDKPLLDDQRRLRVISDMNIGEMVNRIRPINVPNMPNIAVVPKAFLATVEGSIHLFALIVPEKRDLLMRLQPAIADHVQSLGNIPFNAYRAFRNSVEEKDRPERFVDGELVERFLDCPLDVQQSIINDVGLEGVDVESVKALIEGLRRLR